MEIVLISLFLLFIVSLIVISFLILLKKERQIKYRGKWKVLDWRHDDNRCFEMTLITSCGRVCLFKYCGKWEKISGNVELDQYTISVLYKKKQQLLERDQRSSSVWEKISYYDH